MVKVEKKIRVHKDGMVVEVLALFARANRFNEPKFYREEGGYRIYRYSDIRELQGKNRRNNNST